MGLRKRDDRPLGVAIRTYYASPRHDDDYLETWLDLWDGNALLPGYGWIFGVGDGTSNVGLGLLNTSASFGHIDYRAKRIRAGGHDICAAHGVFGARGGGDLNAQLLGHLRGVGFPIRSGGAVDVHPLDRTYRREGLQI